MQYIQFWNRDFLASEAYSSYLVPDGKVSWDCYATYDIRENLREERLELLSCCGTTLASSVFMIVLICFPRNFVNDKISGNVAYGNEKNFLQSSLLITLVTSALCYLILWSSTWLIFLSPSLINYFGTASISLYRNMYVGDMNVCVTCFYMSGLNKWLDQNRKGLRPWRPIGLRDVKDPTLSRQSVHS
jgi:hypothetical protein